MQASVVSVWCINQMHNGEAHAGEHILIKTRSVWEVCCSRDEAETGGSRDTDISAFAVSALRRVSARCRGREGGTPLRGKSTEQLVTHQCYCVRVTEGEGITARLLL